MARSVLGVLCLGLTISAGTAWAQLGNADQKCVNTMNKDASKVQAAQGKLDAACLKIQAMTGASASTCAGADAHRTVSIQDAKTIRDDHNKCQHAPPFGYTGYATTNPVAIAAEENLFNDEFGIPVDSGIASCDTHPAECKCQIAVSLRVENVMRTMDIEFVRCKKAALAIGKLPAFPGGAAMGADIARCINDGTIPQSVQGDPKKALSKAVNLLSAAVTKSCTGGEFDAGACMGTSGAALVDCLVAHAKCRFCQMATYVDDLPNPPLDCTAWSGTTCPTGS